MKIISSLSFYFFSIISKEEVGKSENQGERKRIRRKEESGERKEAREDEKGERRWEVGEREKVFNY